MEMREQLPGLLSWQALKRLDVEESSQFPQLADPGEVLLCYKVTHLK